MYTGKLTFACVKWGNKYGVEYVRILADMIRRNFSGEADFVCLTDDPTGLDCETQPLPAGYEGWWGKLALFQPGRFEGRVCYFDLDVCITGQIDELIEHKGIIDDWHLPGYNSSVMCWDAGEYDHLWTDFKPEYCKRYWSDQDWISKKSTWPIFPASWCLSYKRHCREAVPSGTMVVCFHGLPNPPDVTEGWVPTIWKVGGLREASFKQSMNVEFSQAVDQVAENATLDLPWIVHREPHGKQMVIVGGGPSVKRQLQNIRRRRDKGAVIWTVNGGLDWLMSKGIKPDVYVMMDARPENVKFVEDAPEGVIYLIASQCHPSVFEALKDREVVMWHGDIKQDGVAKALDATKRPWMMIGGGNTVGLRAMYVGFVCGFRDMHLYGFDSCYTGPNHHAYAQPLNDGEETKTFVMGGREYVCAPWMAKQAQDFEQCSLSLMKRGVTIQAHGPGLIPDMNRRINAHYRKERVAA